MHQVGAGPGGKTVRDLVQRERRNKGQREFVHQVLGRSWRKNRPGLGAKETKDQGAGGYRAPSRRRPWRKNRPGLGAKETEEQGAAGFRAPSRRRPRRKNRPGLGAKETEEQGVAGFRAPSRRRSPVGGPSLRRRLHLPRPEAGHCLIPARLQPPRPVVKSTHLSTITFPRIIIKFA